MPKTESVHTIYKSSYLKHNGIYNANNVLLLVFLRLHFPLST